MNTTIQRDGRVTYRTSLFRSLPKAQAFARCLAANETRFERPMVHTSETSRTPKWFVTFEPASDARKDAIHTDQWDARARRAAEQEFIFWPDPDRLTYAGAPCFWWCYSVASGETYEVSIGDCTCPDYQYRCKCAGLQCKHMIAWSEQRAAGLIGKTDKTDRPERRMDVDFGPA